ncbi:zinc finger protein 425-like [Cloeon dipterum]|uniref:zinc finger protein 425-like n=1 Tax=Cloeon dipterum TaxID=197152 RepID=UPI00321FC5E4
MCNNLKSAFVGDELPALQREVQVLGTLSRASGSLLTNSVQVEAAKKEEVCLKHCAHCSASFRRFRDLKEHLLSAHDLIGFKFGCATCGNKFLYKQHLLEHVRVAHMEQCDVEAAKKEEVCLKHCAHCSASFRRFRDLKAHLLSAHDLIGFKFGCATCGNKFLYKQHLVEHVRVAHMEQCDVEAAKKEEVCLKHCAHCSASFRRFRDLKEHLLSAHDLIGFKFGCATCGNKFWYKQHLVEHVRVAHMEQCDVCQKWFSRNCRDLHMKYNHPNLSNRRVTRSMIIGVQINK